MKRCRRKEIMMKFKTSELKAAMGKLAGFIGDTIIIKCTGQCLEGAEGTLLAQVQACNKTAQGMSVCCYSGDKEPKNMLFTNQIQAVVESLSVFGEEVVIEPMEDAAKVSCGTASVNVPFASDAAEIKAVNANDTLVLLFKKDDFQSAVNEGAYVQEEGTIPTLSKTCYILPCVKEDGKRTVKICSTSGYLYGECECGVAIQESDAGLFEQWAQKGLIVKSASLLSVARSLNSDTLYVYLSDKQLMIVTGTEVYSFITVEGSFVNLKDVLKLRMLKDYELKIDKNRIKSAFKVIGLYTESGDGQMSANISITEQENGKVKVCVSDVKEKNHVEFEAEGFGNKEIRVNKPQLIRALDHSAGDIVAIRGTENAPVIFIFGSNEAAFSFNSLCKKN